MLEHLGALRRRAVLALPLSYLVDTYSAVVLLCLLVRGLTSVIQEWRLVAVIVLGLSEQAHVIHRVNEKWKYMACRSTLPWPFMTLGKDFTRYSHLSKSLPLEEAQILMSTCSYRWLILLQLHPQTEDLFTLLVFFRKRNEENEKKLYTGMTHKISIKGTKAACIKCQTFT